MVIKYKSDEKPGYYWKLDSFNRPSGRAFKLFLRFTKIHDQFPGWNTKKMLNYAKTCNLLQIELFQSTLWAGFWKKNYAQITKKPKNKQR